ncbi:hypothetical protein Tco_0803584 [Tanacetum coccineum]|uniref:Uncharacterized protein n=1 Tax=Tanacetum coccineum TaxID=301880 RepID=A0ABQ5A4R4_9ASTR
MDIISTKKSQPEGKLTLLVGSGQPVGKIETTSRNSEVLEVFSFFQKILQRKLRCGYTEVDAHEVISFDLGSVDLTLEYTGGKVICVDLDDIVMSYHKRQSQLDTELESSEV